MHHISDLHSKFALRPHHVWKYGRTFASSHPEKCTTKEDTHIGEVRGINGRWKKVNLVCPNSDLELEC